MDSPDLPRSEITVNPPPSHEIFKENQPLQYLGELGEGITGITYAVIFNPAKMNEPVLGLGEWVQQRRDLAEKMKVGSGHWLEFPSERVGENPYLAIKVAHSNSQAEGQLSAERYLHEKLNRIFSRDQNNRPVRLYGYGVSKGDYKQNPYLITELVPESFIQIKRLQNYTEADVIEFALGVAEIYAKLHKSGLVHNDPNIDNFFYNPQNRAVRIIDFGNSDDSERGLVASYGADREGLGKNMFRLLTGVEYKRNISDTQLDQSLNRFAPETQAVVKKLLYCSSDKYDPFNPNETDDLYKDLLGIVHNFGVRGAKRNKDDAPVLYSRDPEKLKSRLQELDAHKLDLARRIQIITNAISGKVSLVTDEEKGIYAQFIGGKNPQQIQEALVRFQNTQRIFNERWRILSIGSDQEYNNTVLMVEKLARNGSQQIVNTQSWLEYYRKHWEQDTPAAKKAESDLKMYQENLMVYKSIIDDREAVQKDEN